MYLRRAKFFSKMGKVLQSFVYILVGCHNITTSAKKYFSKKFIDLKTTADKDYVLQRLRLKWLRPTKATFEKAPFEKATLKRLR